MISTGEQIGRYRIRSAIGKGGMGEVFLAEDTELERIVALKVLPEDLANDTERMRRFVQEAKSASALNHPNIITIHEIGKTDSTHFIATEYIEGETLHSRLLSEPMYVKNVLDVAIQVASALDAAHRAGIVHRDIKPENVMIRPDGLVKILDFGIAKLTERKVAAIEAEAATAIKAEGTSPGMIIGTAAYMSPEQARGKDIDARSDIFSFGVVLYEMLSGKPPFEGENALDVIGSILNKEPVPIQQLIPEVPQEIGRIISKALKKDREERYQTAKDLLIDLKDVKQDLEIQNKLERTAAPNREEPKTQILSAATSDAAHTTSSAEYITNEIKSHKNGLAIGLVILVLSSIGLGYWFLTSRSSSTKGQIESIAIMPFVNESGNADTEYLSDGMTETLISSLSQLPNLLVKARSSVFRYKGKDTDLQQIGKELNVQSVLNGRVVQRGQDLTLYIELVDTATEKVLWSENYNRKQADLISLQSELARDVSSKLKTRLSGVEEQQVTKTFTENTEAYQLYLKGRYHWNKRTTVDLPKSVDYFNQAIEKDPSYALAYASLAEAFILLPNYTNELPKNAFPKAKEAATKSLQIDESLAEGHNALAAIKHEYEWDFVNAEKEFKRAIELNPNYATAHHWYGEFLWNMGRIEEGNAEIRRAQELDPLSLIINSIVGVGYYIKGQNDQAIEHLKKTIEMDSSFPRAHLFLAEAYENKKLFEDAITEHQKHFLLNGAPSDFVEKQAAEWREAFKRDGENGYWRKHIQILERIRTEKRNPSPPISVIAYMYVQIGENDKAFSLMEEAFREREVELLRMRAFPAGASIRSDPRFIELERRIGFPR
jgi:serine/threonine-protein kinase